MKWGHNSNSITISNDEFYYYMLNHTLTSSQLLFSPQFLIRKRSYRLSRELKRSTIYLFFFAYRGVYYQLNNYKDHNLWISNVNTNKDVFWTNRTRKKKRQSVEHFRNQYWHIHCKNVVIVILEQIYYFYKHNPYMIY